MRVLCLIVLLFGVVVVEIGAKIQIDSRGIYSGVTIKVTDSVPRQKCQRALDNLEVS